MANIEAEFFNERRVATNIRSQDSSILSACKEKAKRISAIITAIYE